MAVYVDQIFKMNPRIKQYKRLGDYWCHLWGDSATELVEFAKKIGVKEEWIQVRSMVHFDLTPEQRTQAIANGAVEVDIEDDSKETKEFLAKQRDLAIAYRAVIRTPHMVPPGTWPPKSPKRRII